MTTPLYYIKNGYLSFADKTVFEQIEIYLYPGDKICLVGRNGCGKSSLMKVLNGDYELDSGEIYKDPSTIISYLRQDSKIYPDISVYDFILKNLPIEAKYRADIIFNKLQIDGAQIMSSLSGGQLRRANLAKALVDEPEVLLLDEPTNHLDIAAIEWLEEYVRNYAGIVICISHDRSFLSNVTNKLWWLDRGTLRKSDRGFKYFEEWQEQIITYEESRLKKLQKKLDEENVWLSQGVTARRKRNQKRLADLLRLRETMRAKIAHTAIAKQKIEALSLEEAKKTRFIIETDKVCFSYDGRKNIVNDFSFRVKKGEKIGIIGPNGSGKSSLIKLLLKELDPTSGRVRHGVELEITYFDQHRSELNPAHSIKQTLCPGGGDQIMLKDRALHVASYLKNFMFDPKIMNAKVSTLSGGEASRLLLAKTLINPGNLLVLDEPTNDLDMDTLEILIEILNDYTGTALIVSHDRDFLEKLATRTLIFTSDNKIIDSIGGYEDYVKYHRPKPEIPPKTMAKKTQARQTEVDKAISRKLSYKDQRLLNNIPGEIDALEARIVEIEQELGRPALYEKDPEKFAKLSCELMAGRNKVEELTEAWLRIA